MAGSAAFAFAADLSALLEHTESSDYSSDLLEGLRGLASGVAGNLPEERTVVKTQRSKLRRYAIDWDNIDDGKCIEMTR